MLNENWKWNVTKQMLFPLCEGTQCHALTTFMHVTSIIPQYCSWVEHCGYCFILTNIALQCIVFLLQAYKHIDKYRPYRNNQIFVWRKANWLALWAQLVMSALWVQSLLLCFSKGSSNLDFFCSYILYLRMHLNLCATFGI